MPRATENVLVTGATGFVATHVVHQLVDAGYHVFASTRDTKRTAALYDRFPSYVGNVDFVAVPDFTAVSAFDDVLKDGKVDYILHIAAPLPGAGPDALKDLIEPAVQGIENLFSAGQKFGGERLKRIVVTGSGVSLVNLFGVDGTTRGNRYDETDWNPITAQVAIDSGNGGLAYIASKVLSEKAAWKYIEDNKPQFDLTVLLPVIVLGLNLSAVKGPDDIEQGAKRDIYSLIDGTRKSVDEPFNFYSHVDVRDVAAAHLQAIARPAAGGQRISLSSHDVFSPQTVVDIIEKRFPQLANRVVKGNKDQLYPPGAHPILFSGLKAHRFLGENWQFRSLEESVTAVLNQILDQEPGWKQ